MKRLLIAITLICATAGNSFAMTAAARYLQMAAASSGGGSGASYTDSFATISSYWITMTDSYVLTSHTTYATGSHDGARSCNYYNRTISANQYIQINIDDMYNSEIFVRGASSGVRYRARYNGSTVFLEKCSAIETCSSLNSATYTVPTSAAIRLTVDSNNTLTFLSNSTSVVTYTDSSSPISSGFPGIGPYGTNAAVTNASMGDL